MLCYGHNNITALQTCPHMLQSLPQYIPQHTATNCASLVWTDDSASWPSHQTVYPYPRTQFLLLTPPQTTITECSLQSVMLEYRLRHTGGVDCGGLLEEL